MKRKSITPEKARFVRFELENGDGRRRKVALQEIARLYRAGYHFLADARNSIELAINGLLWRNQLDDKVTRWCLNCIAQMGTRNGSIQAVERILRQRIGDPEIIAAAVAAAAKLYAGQLSECDALGAISPEIRILAALQITSPVNLDLSNFRINIDTADDEVLKLALITVGLNKAYENLFDPRYTNGELVRQLCSHDNSIIKQYSVWSVIENSSLNLDHLGIDFGQIEHEPSNVQSKLLQLGAEQISDPMHRQQVILQGSYLPSVEAREGLAKGLSNVFYEGLQDITLEWFNVESSLRVKEILAEHFSRFSSESPSYFERSLEIFDDDNNFHSRIMLGAEGTPLYKELKIAEQQRGIFDLFGTTSNPIVSKLIGDKVLKSKKVLMMCASPIDENPLRLDQEARDLKEQIRLVDKPKQTVSIEHAWAIRADQVQMEILNVEPHVLHFSGHGDTGILCFENAAGKATPISAVAIDGLIKLSNSVECVILNACYSDSISKIISGNGKAVIGCNTSIKDQSAVMFSRAFYRALVHDRPYRVAFDLAINELQLNGREKDAMIYTFIEGKSK